MAKLASIVLLLLLGVASCSASELEVLENTGRTLQGKLTKSKLLAIDLVSSLINSDDWTIVNTGTKKPKYTGDANANGLVNWWCPDDGFICMFNKGSVAFSTRGKPISITFGEEGETPQPVRKLLAAGNKVELTFYLEAKKTGTVKTKFAFFATQLDIWGEKPKGERASFQFLVNGTNTALSKGGKKLSVGHLFNKEQSSSSGGDQAASRDLYYDGDAPNPLPARAEVTVTREVQVTKGTETMFTILLADTVKDQETAVVYFGLHGLGIKKK